LFKSSECLSRPSPWSSLGCPLSLSSPFSSSLSCGRLFLSSVEPLSASFPVLSVCSFFSQVYLSHPVRSNPSPWTFFLFYLNCRYKDFSTLNQFSALELLSFFFNEPSFLSFPLNKVPSFLNIYFGALPPRPDRSFFRCIRALFADPPFLYHQLPRAASSPIHPSHHLRLVPQTAPILKVQPPPSTP